MRLPTNKPSEVENRNRAQERMMSVGFRCTSEMVGWAEVGHPRCSLSRRRVFQCKLLIISAIIPLHGTWHARCSAFPAA
jgi:hypothetical protein